MEKSSQTRAVLILLAWVTPWLPSWNSGVTLVRGAPSRMPTKKTQDLGNIRDVKSQRPPVAPSAAVECAAAGDTTPGMVDDDEGYSSCSEGPQDRTFGEETGVDPRQTTLTMHWAQTAFRTAREPRSKHGELLNCRDGVPLPL